MTKTEDYISPNPNVRREHFGGEAGGAGTTEYAKFRHFQATRLANVHAYVTTAGTLTTHALDVFQGTTSVGTMLLGTSAANTLVSASASSLALDFTSGEQMSVKTLADTVGKAHVVYEHHVSPGALLSS